MSRLQVAQVSDLGEFEHLYSNRTSKVDIAEICGGEGRAGHVATRRRVRVGPNYDLVLGVGLARRGNQSCALRCFAE
eukprot:5391765-Alexandrium_andersonii.AAC.1